MIRTSLLLVSVVALSPLFSTTLAQGAGGVGNGSENSVFVKHTPPPKTVLGPVEEDQNFSVTNNGTSDVTLYVVEDDADPLPEGWKLGDDLPRGWEKGATLRGGKTKESTVIGTGSGGEVVGLSHGKAGSNLTWH